MLKISPVTAMRMPFADVTAYMKRKLWFRRCSPAMLTSLPEFFEIVYDLFWLGFQSFYHSRS
jgi:hypothetical protein